MAKILVIDDDSMYSLSLCDMVCQLGHEADRASTIREGIARIASEAFDVVFLDVMMPDGSGLNALKEIRESPFVPEVIIITGGGDPDGAELAIKEGAWDYILKSSSLKDMILPLMRALQYRGQKRVGPPRVILKRDNIIGNSPRMKPCLDLLAKAAGCSASVLISGETGTGKELFAYATHASSSRADESFVVLDCAALPETLVESILFGHEKGAFTGAGKAQDGLIKLAHRGTLFLDEVGELPHSIQGKFLRVLHERRFRPVGGRQEIESDFRLIAATNRDLEEMVRAGRFREDLLYRIRTFNIELPPLRDRIEDIVEIAAFHTARLCRRYGMEEKAFSPEFLETLAAYSWPGNVRELVNTLENVMATVGREPTLFPKHLPVHIRIEVARGSVGGADQLETHPHRDFPFLRSKGRLRDVRDAAIAEAEKRYLETLMPFVRGDIREACRIAGLSRSRLYSLLKKYEVFPCL